MSEDSDESSVEIDKAIKDLENESLNEEPSPVIEKQIKKAIVEKQEIDVSDLNADEMTEANTW